MRFVVFTEGETERQVVGSFLRQWFHTQFQENIGVRVVKFEGWADYLKHVEVKARMHLNARPGTDPLIGVIGMLDLYGPTIFPREMHTSEEKYRWGQKYVEQQVGQGKFKQFFAVHEIEAWLLSQPAVFPREIESKLQHIRTPETINSNEPPAKLLKNLYRRELGKGYKKVVHGKQLFEKLDPEIAYEKCPRLREMLDELARMARESGAV